jgi:hypothetical protein
MGTRRLKRLQHDLGTILAKCPLRPPLRRSAYDAIVNRLIVAVASVVAAAGCAVGSADSLEVSSTTRSRDQCMSTMLCGTAAGGMSGAAETQFQHGSMRPISGCRGAGLRRDVVPLHTLGW